MSYVVAVFLPSFCRVFAVNERKEIYKRGLTEQHRIIQGKQQVYPRATTRLYRGDCITGQGDYRGITRKAGSEVEILCQTGIFRGAVIGLRFQNQMRGFYCPGYCSFGEMEQYAFGGLDRSAMHITDLLQNEGRTAAHYLPDNRFGFSRQDEEKMTMRNKQPFAMKKKVFIGQSVGMASRRTKPLGRTETVIEIRRVAYDDIKSSGSVTGLQRNSNGTEPIAPRRGGEIGICLPNGFGRDVDTEDIRFGVLLRQHQCHQTAARTYIQDTARLAEKGFHPAPCPKQDTVGTHFHGTAVVGYEELFETESHGLMRMTFDALYGFGVTVVVVMMMSAEDSDTEINTHTNEEDGADGAEPYFNLTDTVVQLSDTHH